MFSSIVRIRLLTFEILKEIVLHNRWFQLCLLGLMIFVLGGRLLTSLPLGESAPKLLFDFGLGAILLVSGCLVVILLCYQLDDELRSGTVYHYLVRSVSRWEYLIGKAIGGWLAVVTLVLAADLLLMILVNHNVGEVRNSGGDIIGPGSLAWVQIFLFQMLHLFVLSSLTLFIASLSESFLFNAIISLFIWMTGILISGSGNLITSAQGFLEILFQTLHWMIPRFQPVGFFDLIWYSGIQNSMYVLKAILVALLYSILFISFATQRFNRRSL
ncbi:MAG: ABC transporter permease subunit [Verrucomicrobia bacterium]|nr:ABC transporter permease subunit [Verrucomicrobiota bacterium]MDA1068724.1 ABC transporter permease subunit [Verrucomicrobiota bacterium]